ncbi:DMT family transporter [Marinoscillum sp. MHG1-6]|uniref:DMT family transporter n=1 Tax=Marinoscillum sp. MHG1-6 TaxID=2959627 RepID=UPI002156F829|nr:DMT family transporter [Marinoscillum sp. MHG1-6]
MNQSTSNLTQGMIPGVVSALGWSTTGIFVKLLPDFSAWFLVSARSAVALIATIIFVALVSNFSLNYILRQWTNWWLASLMIVYYVTAVAAYQLTSVAEVALLLNTSPVFALLIRVYRGGTVKILEWVGAAVAIGGLLLIVLPDILTVGEYGFARLFGCVLALTSSYCITVYATQLEAFRSKGVQLSNSGITLLTYILGATMLFVVSLIVDTVHPFDLDFTGSNILLIVGLGLISTVIPSVAYGMAMSHISAVQLTTLRLTIPVSATLLAFWILDEIPNHWVIPGGVLVITGIIIMLKRKKG